MIELQKERKSSLPDGRDAGAEMRAQLLAACASVAVVLSGCSGESPIEDAGVDASGPTGDSGSVEAGVVDAGATDASIADAASSDASDAGVDAAAGPSLPACEVGRPSLAEEDYIDPDTTRDGVPSPWGPAGDWRLTFSDEFNREELGCKWNAQWGSPGEYWGPPNTVAWSEEVMYPDNVELNGSELGIRHQVRDGEVTSGVITTNGLFSQRHGYFEARLKACDQPGTLSAFWMQYAPDSWPPEIDVVEILGREPRTPYTTIHYGPPPPDNLAAGFHTDTGVEYGDDFHVFGVEWSPDELVFYIDGVEYWRTPNPGGTFDEQPMYPQFNIHSGNGFSGYPDLTIETPCFMWIDFIRVYQRAG